MLLSQRIDMTGKNFGDLTVIKYFDTSQNRQARWLCQCKCGNTTVVSGNLLRSNKTKSCGCFKNRPSKRWNGYNDISGSFWWHVKDKADKRNIVFDISIQCAWDKYVLQNKKCFLTGLPLIFVRQYGTNGDKSKQNASLDRINSNEGYVENNIQWLHKTINRLKNKFDQNEFIRWCCLIRKKYGITKRDCEYTNKELISVHNKYHSWKGCGAISGNYLYSIKNNAKSRNLVFNINDQDLWRLFLSQDKKCAITGIDLCFVNNYRLDKLQQTASLDRKDPTKGYIWENIQWIHKDVNRIKLNLQEEKLLYWCGLVSDTYLMSKHGNKNDNTDE